MALKKPSEIFMSFDADEKLLEDIRRSIGDTIADLNFSTKEKNSIMLAIEEACTNVIRHAYLYGPGTIRIRVRIFPNKVVFSIFDKGRKFDFGRADSPDLNRYVKTGRKGGLGLYLIRKMMDSVDYYSRDGENELRMVKNIKPKKQRKLTPKGASIRLKFTMWASLLVVVLAGAIGYYYDHRNINTIKDSFFYDAVNFAHITALNASDKIVVGNELELSGLARSGLDGNPNLKYIVIVDNNNLIWADVLNPQNLLSPYIYPAELDTTIIDQLQDINSDEFGSIYHMITEIKLNEQKLGEIHLGFSKTGLAEQLKDSRRIILFFVLLGTIIGLVSVYILSNYFVKPIQKLTEGVLKIGQGNLEESLPVEGTDEFSEIARAFNEITTKFKNAQDSVVEKELLQKEMQVAQEIQHALLPNRFPEIEGYELAAVYRAAKDVGGDYFDFVWIDEETLGIAVADVSGKGVPGSLVMTMIRTAIRLEARDNKSPAEILAKVNNFVAEDVKKGMFITIFFIVLDSKERQISFASAGHNPMILYRKDTEKCYFLNPKGIPLGMTLPDDISFGGALKTDKLKLKKDDMLVIYTDGITEAMNNRSEQYGNDRLINFIKENSYFSPEEFVQKLDKDLVQFTGNAPQNDDITLVVVKEKIMADELVLEKRKRLLDMVENEGISIEDACEEMGVSPSTFYKYRRRYRELGEAGLLNKNLRADAGIKQLPYTARKIILDIVRESPLLGPARIQKKMAELGENYTVKNIYDELINMRLNTKKLRLAYVDRVGQLKSEQKELLEKEILREKQKDLDRDQYADDLKINIEKRQVKQITKETGKVFSHLKQLGPSAKSGNLYKEIAKELEKLNGGKEIAGMFTSMITKMDGDIHSLDKSADGLTSLKAESAVEESIKNADISDKTPIKLVEVAPVSDVKIDIDSKAIKPDDSDDIEPEPEDSQMAESKLVETSSVNDDKTDEHKKDTKKKTKDDILSDMAEYEKKLMKKFNK
ncbi:MAG: SpoIIE family protein phosphatase [candidate division Zixibacteria bacterium]|nr:SpoIIE family protein phosphatase [candidate division Zixibacteria bacterium]